MKKYCFLLLSSVMAFALSGQVWIDTGAVWHYDYWNIAEEGFAEYTYTQDTLIDGHLCQEIEGKLYRYGLAGPGEGYAFFGTSNLGKYYTYVDGDTVFYRTNDTFYVMLNFGAAIGDSWVISNEVFEVCNDTSIALVTATGSVEIEGVNYRTITLEMEANSSSGFQGVFCERFGNMSVESNAFNYLFPNTFECEALSEIGIFEWNYFSFKCFEDESFTLYNPVGEACDWWRVNVGVQESEFEQWTVYPNPTSGLLHLDGIPLGSTYVLYNLMGEEIQHGEIDGDLLELSNVSAGIYLLMVNNHFQRICLKP